MSVCADAKCGEACLRRALKHILPQGIELEKPIKVARETPQKIFSYLTEVCAGANGADAGANGGADYKTANVMKPGHLVIADHEMEVMLRRAEASLARALFCDPASTSNGELLGIDDMIDSVHEIAGSLKKMPAFQKSHGQVRLLFLVEPKSKLSGPVLLTDCPSLAPGFKSGLVLCMVGLKPGSQVKDVSNVVDLTGEDTSDWCKGSNMCKFQRGTVWKVHHVSEILPLCLIKLDNKHCVSVALRYIERADIAPTTSNGTTARPSKKSKVELKSSLLAKHPLASYFDAIVSHEFAKSDEDCSICTFNLKDEGMYDSDNDKQSDGATALTHVRYLGILKDCGHAFHEKCLTEGLLSHHKDHVQCPKCKKIYGKKMGIQPTSMKMLHRTKRLSLAGYENCDAIEIRYECKPGVQGPEHPNPGLPFICPGFPRVAYLPNNPKGQKVLRLLKRAFDQRLVFTVGRSVTLGADNCVTWNDIHHKTQAHRGGEHGYPDPKYLDSVISDLAQHDITE